MYPNSNMNILYRPGPLRKMDELIQDSGVVKIRNFHIQIFDKFMPKGPSSTKLLRAMECLFALPILVSTRRFNTIAGYLRFPFFG